MNMLIHTNATSTVCMSVPSTNESKKAKSEKWQKIPNIKINDKRKCTNLTSVSQKPLTSKIRG